MISVQQCVSLFSVVCFLGLVPPFREFCDNIAKNTTGMGVSRKGGTYYYYYYYYFYYYFYYYYYY